MPLETFTEEEAIEFIKARMRALYTEPDLSRFSDLDIEARILAALFRGNQAQAQYNVRNLFPETCDPDLLDSHAKARGMTRQPAAKAKGKIIAQASASSVAISTGLQLTYPDGTKAVVTSTATTSTPSFTGKTVADGTSKSRLIVSPHALVFAVDDIFEVDGDYDGTAALFAVKTILTTWSAIEPYRSTRVVIPTSDTITPITGAVVEIEAAEIGFDGNKDPWETITFDSPPANVTAAATVIEMSGGGDEESDEELRARIVAYDQGRAGNANLEQYRQWAMEVPDVRVARAFVFPNVLNFGQVDIVVEGPSGARELGSTAVATIQAYIDSQAPPTEISRVIAGNYTLTQDLTFSVRPKLGYEPDWGPTIDNPSPASSFTITSTTSTTTFLQFAVDPSTTVEVGDRIAIQTINGVVVREVTGLQALGLDISPALDSVPQAGDIVMPGGPLTQPIIDAVASFFDDLGPGIASGSDRFKRWPDPGVEGPDSIYIPKLHQIIMAIPGVDDVTFTTPAADVLGTVLLSLRQGTIIFTFEAT